MRQAVLVGDHRLELVDVADPVPAPGEVLVRTRYVGICGSDLHIAEGLHPGVKRPIVLGHECVGVVATAAPGAPPVGTPVAVNPLFSCGTCMLCRNGQRWVCERREVMGFHRPGCLAELLSLPVTHLIPLHDGQDEALATLFEPLAVTMHAASLADAKSGDRVIVVGAGSVGLLLSLYLREVIGADVSILEINPARLEFVCSLGFKAAGKLSDLDLSGLSERPLAFDCVGRAESCDTILDIFPPPRAAVLVGTYEPTASMNLLRFKRYEMRAVGSMIYPDEDLKRAVDVLASPAGAQFARLLVPGQFEFSETADAFEAAAGATVGTKVLVRMGSS